MNKQRPALVSAIGVFFGIFGAKKTLLLSTDGPPKNMITSPAVPETKEGSMSVAEFSDYIFNYSGGLLRL